MPVNPMAEGGPSTRIVQLTEAVTLEELSNDEEYQDILEDMRDECGKVRLRRRPSLLGCKSRGCT